MLHTDINSRLLAVCQPNKNVIDIGELKHLLVNGANPSSIHDCHIFPIPSSFPLLHVIAGKDNSVEAAKLLIEYGAKLNETDTNIGNTPLLTAIALNDKVLASFFIEYISRNLSLENTSILNQQDISFECQNTPIMLSLKKGMEDITIMLIHAGADVNVIGRNGQTALHWACILRENIIIKELIEHKANVHQFNDYKRTPYEYYVYDIKYIDLAYPISEYGIITALTSNMAEFSDLYHHVSSYKRDLEVSLQYFIDDRNKISTDQFICDSIIPTAKSEISLHQQHRNIINAQYKKNKDKRGLEYENILKQCSEEKIMERFENAPLSLAVMQKNKDKIKTLLENNVDINAASSDGFTALHWAAMARNEEMISLLINKGANPNLSNKLERTAFDYYTHQISAADFKSCVSDKVYQDLCKYIGSHVQTDKDIMPEFDDFFYIDSSKFVVVPRRNQKEINVNIFGCGVSKKENVKQQEIYIVKNTHIETNVTPISIFIPKNDNDIPDSLENALTDGGLRTNYINKNF